MGSMLVATRLRVAVVLAVVGFLLLVFLLSEREARSLMSIKMITTVE